MTNSRTILAAFVIASLGIGAVAVAQKFSRPAPSQADWAAIGKLPDFTGVWEAPPRGRAAAAAKTPPEDFGRAGAQRLGAGADPAGPSLTPEYAAKAKAAAGKPPADSSANCLPPGLPGFMTAPYPYEFLMTPGQVTLISEAHSQVRHIYTDGRPLPEDPDPNFYGTSIGHWEDKTLVVESVGFEQVPRGLNFPYSDKLKIVERFRLTDADTMTIETTLIDPEAFKAPYSMGSRTLKRHRNWTIAEYVCEENNRNFTDAQGKAGVTLANPLSAPR